MAKRKFKRQRVFNQIVEHLFKQGGPATHRNTTTCVYRTNPLQPERSARACGIGSLMTNDAYRGSAAMKADRRNKLGVYAGAPEVLAVLGWSDIGSNDIDFLAAAQRELHDMIINFLPHGRVSGKRRDREFMAVLPSEVRRFAQEYDLKVPSIVPKAYLNEEDKNADQSFYL